MDVTSYLLGKKAGGGSSVNNQNKDVTITENGSTTVSADEGYTGLGTVGITTNVQPDLESKSVTITSNTTTTITPSQGKDGLSNVSVTTNVPANIDLNDYYTNTITAGSSTIGGYIYSLKSVMPPTTVSGTSLAYAYYQFQGNNIDLSHLDASDVTTMDSMFSNSKVETVNMTGIDLSSVTTTRSMFANNGVLKNVIGLNDVDTSSLTDTAAMFRYCTVLETIDISGMDLGNVTNVTNMFGNASALKNVSFGYNLGKSYPSDATAGTGTPTTLTFKNSSSLTHDSAVNIINNLYDISNITDTPQWVVFSSTTYNTLTQQEIDIATAKGWEVKR